MKRKTNWLAIAVAVVVSMVIGFLWYGMLFTETWAAANGITLDMENHKAFKNGVEMSSSPLPMIFNIACTIVFALLMNWLLGRTGSVTWPEGAKVGAVVGLFLALSVCIGILFADRDRSLITVDALHPLIQLTVMGAIIGGWQKK